MFYGNKGRFNEKKKDLVENLKEDLIVSMENKFDGK